MFAQDFSYKTSCCLLPLRTSGFGFTSTDEGQNYYVVSKKYTTLVKITCRNNSDQLFYCTLCMLTLPLTMNAPIIRTLASTASILFSFLLPKSQTTRAEDGYHSSSIDCSHKTTHGIFHLIEETTGQLKISGIIGTVL